MSDVTLPRVEKVSIIDQIVHVLRQSIVDGELAPGARLREVELSRQLGVSRGSVREALIRLEADGLVVSEAGRGASVVTLSADDIEEIYALRLLLEKEAVHRVARRASAEQLQQLLYLADDMIEAAAVDDVPRILKQNIRFHRLIWQWTGNSRLYELLRTFYAQVQLYLASSMYFQTHAQRVQSMAEHRQIVEALIDGDVATAAAVMETHLAEAERLVGLFMQTQGSDEAAWRHAHGSP